jgi:hypothetical protein
MLLTDSVMQYVMSEVFATINHRLSEEYARIELPTPDAKERYVQFHHISTHPNAVLAHSHFAFPTTDFSQTRGIFMRSSRC